MRESQGNGMNLKLKKINPPSWGRTAYQVFLGGKEIGFVWSRTELSYRGTQGWNRGVRLQDFHPICWRFSGSDMESGGFLCFNRESGIRELMRAEGTSGCCLE